jgi:hypothetical protein
MVDLKAAAWLASNSSENDLKLVSLYPKLDENATDECKQAWERSTATLSCHHTILSTAFDNSNTTDAGAVGMDPDTSTKIICDIQCARALSTLAEAVRDLFQGRMDRFNLTVYDHDGLAYFPKASMEE